ncbi:MAG: hypothetical protein O7I93_10100 [Gemmatimonadetes bacterium]|nr:hypothetical protein [Gemmatimonadota bacterium]
MSPTALGTLILAALLIPLGLAYAAHRRVEGARAARRLLVLGVGVMVFFGAVTLVAMSAFPRSWVAPLVLALEGIVLVVEVAMLFTWPRRRRRLGNVLHELPRGLGQMVFLLLSVIGIIGLSWGARTVGIPRSSGDWALFGLLLVTLPGFVAEGLSRWKFGERGMLHFRRFVPWVRVKSYRWKRSGRLRLWLKGRSVALLDFDWLASLIFEIPVAGSSRETLRALVETKLPEANLEHKIIALISGEGERGRKFMEALEDAMVEETPVAAIHLLTDLGLDLREAIRVVRSLQERLGG